MSRRKIIGTAAVFIAILTVLTACGGNGDKDKLIGKWYGTSDIGADMGMDEKCELTYVIEFDENNVSLSVDTAAFAEELSAAVKKSMEKQIAAEGITVEQFEKTAQTTLDEYIKGEVDKELKDIDSDSVIISGEYTLQDGSVVTADSAVGYEFDKEGNLRLNLDDLSDVVFKKK